MVSSPFQVTHPYSPPGPFPSHPPFPDDRCAGANGPIHLSSTRAEPPSPAAHHHGAGRQLPQPWDAVKMQSRWAMVETWGSAIWRPHGGRKGREATKCLEHAEVQVAAVTHECWSDRLGKGLQATLLLNLRWALARGVLHQAAWLEKPGF